MNHQVTHRRIPLFIAVVYFALQAGTASAQPYFPPDIPLISEDTLNDLKNYYGKNTRRFAAALDAKLKEIRLKNLVTYGHILTPPILPPKISSDYGTLIDIPEAQDAKCLASAGAVYHPNGRFLYFSAGTGSPGKLCGYTIDPVTGESALIAGTPAATASIPGGVAIDPSGRFLFSVGGSTGTVSVFAIDGTTGKPTPVAGSPFDTNGSLPKTVTTDRAGRYLYVGQQRGSFDGSIAVFAVNRATGALTHIAGSPFNTTGSARRFALSPDGRFLFATDFGVRTYAVDATTGAITPVATQGDFFASSVAVDLTGRFLYAIDPGLYVVREFAIAASGALTPLGTQPLGTPAALFRFSEGITIAGDLVYIARSYDDLVYGFRIDVASGALKPVTGSPFSVPGTPIALAVGGGIPRQLVLDAGDTFADTFPVTGGEPPYTWSIATGALPPGLALNAQTGVVSGTAAVAGLYTFTAQVADSTGTTAVASTTIQVAGIAPPAAPVSVVEFYNASLDHYFITWVAEEIAKLDAGVVIKGWARTGKSFLVYNTPQAGTSAVCRFYIPPAKGDSHFFGRGTTECFTTGQKNPTFDLEDPRFMYVFLPAAGVCPANATQVYRVFSNRPDANHRYMTEKAVRDQMVAMNWLAEGDGPDLVVMCAPLP
ncbi:MAG: beta-propeller fold lactonase family protein [Casimicrobiaceae bacterium]